MEGDRSFEEEQVSINSDSENILHTDNGRGSENDENEEECSGNDDGFSIEYDVPFEENDITHTELGKLTKKIRKIVKAFRRSPTKNDVLQKYAVSEFGKEYCLILDCKTRWNSLIEMLERFYMMRSCLKKSIIDLNLDVNFSDSEFNEVSLAISALLPVRLAVEALCREDANLLSADATFEFMFAELERTKSSLSNELLTALKQRVFERRTELSDLIRYLHQAYEEDLTTDRNLDSNFKFRRIPKNDIVKCLLNVVNQKGLWKSNDEIIEELVEDDVELIAQTEDETESEFGSKNLMKKKLDQAICKKLNYTVAGKKTRLAQDLVKCLRKEMSLFEDEGTRGVYLQQVYDLLLTVQPTSVESERAFSSAGILLNKLRSRLNDETLDSLCMLRSYFRDTKNA